MQKDERCFSASGCEYKYVCQTPEGQHIVRPVLESEDREEVLGDLRQVDAVYTAEECDRLRYKRREILKSEIADLERKRASLRLTTTQEEALAQHATLANLADWLAGKEMFYVTHSGRDVQVLSTKQEGGELSIRRWQDAATCEWWINGQKATFRGMFATHEQAAEVARSIVQSDLAGQTAWWPQLEPSIRSAQRLGVLVPESLTASRAEYQRKAQTEELARAKSDLAAAQERVNKLARGCDN